MTHAIRTYPLVFFTILACVVGWIFFIAAGLGAGVSPDNMPLGPIVAAAIVAAGVGRAGLSEWWRQLRTFRTSFGWYALAIVAPVAIITISVLANYAFGAPLPTPSQLAGWTGLPMVFLFFLVLVGIGEEAGWMAFAAPRLLSRHTFLMAWAILSAIRILWHLPLMLTGELPWVLGLAGNAGFQFLLLWIFVRSGGVWFLAALWHAMLNMAGGGFFFQMVQGADRTQLGVLMSAAYVIVAVGVFLADRRRLARTGVIGAAAGR